MEKKPSERITELQDKFIKINGDSRPAFVATFQAIIGYLDEQYEKQQRAEANRLMNIKNEK